jgi:Sigma-70 region 2
MLGSVSEAEDVVQEAFVRLYRELEAGTRIEAPEAYFATVVTRLAIDELRSARARREVYTGEWLPEPILTAEDEDPARQAEIADSLSGGLPTVLETLSPEERAVLGKSPAAVRQLAVRARRHVGAREPRFETSLEQRDRLARTMLGFRRTGERFGGVTIRRAEVNGGPGALSFGPDGKLLSVLSLEIAEGQVQAVRSVVNPDKLAHLGPVGDFRALLSRAARRDRHS